MFTPSRSLLFRPMPALNKLKIHQPLPLNPREATQLLNLLTTSFRQQLDTEHASFRTETARQSADTSIDNPHPRPRRASFPEPWKNPDRHLHSVLTNPLFNYSTDVPRRGRRKLEPNDPFLLFDSAVAHGMMDLGHAKVLLQAKRREIVNSPVMSIREGMRESGAGLKVLKWLIASGATNDLVFLKDEAFASLLIQYMVAEGLQEVTWTWIKRSFEGLSLLSAPEHRTTLQQLRRSIAAPLVHLVKAEAEGPVSLDSAYLCLSRALGYLKGFSTMDLNIALGPAGRWLLYTTLQPASQPPPPPSESSFESFLSLVPLISIERDYNFAHLGVLHPQKPSAGLAMKFLRGIRSDREATKPSLTRERKYIQLGLDTAKLLLEKHEYNDVEWVMAYLRTNYPGQLGVKQVRQLERAKAEASSLDMLEGLSLV